MTPQKFPETYDDNQIIAAARATRNALMAELLAMGWAWIVARFRRGADSQHA